LSDRYSEFAELAANETYGIDYRVCFENRGTSIAVLAPHGGWIEPGTSEIAAAIARDDYSIYAFEGLRRRPHGDLHIKSHLFDEPHGRQLVGEAETSIAIHGRADDGDRSTVRLGGLNNALRDAVGSSLEAARFVVALAESGMAARDPANICNRGTTGRGVQLELPLTLRNELVGDPARLRSFADAVREAMLER
jgi:phage replication-related protein YjqB (UPF0714/DUF867 family)